MTNNDIDIKIKKIVDKYNFIGKNKYTLIVLFGLLGDFDSIEYAINLKNFIRNKKIDLNIFALAIGEEKGKEKFCNFTGFPKENLEVIPNNNIHNFFSNFLWGGIYLSKFWLLFLRKHRYISSTDFKS